MVFLSSCGTISATISSAMRDTSKYQPPFRIALELDNYFDLITLDSGKVVTDELGMYYHKVTGSNLQKTYINKIDDGVLRNMFSGTVGLLTPVYIYKNTSSGARVSIDWNATKRQHLLFTKKLKLKLLPLSTTKKYQKVVEKEAIANYHPGGSFDATTQSALINKSGVKADYIIDHGHLEDFYQHYALYKRGYDSSSETEFYEYAADRIMTNSGVINFIPVSLLNESTSGNNYMRSGCMFIDMERYKKRFSEMMSNAFYGVKVTKLKASDDTSSPDKIREANRRAEKRAFKESYTNFSLATSMQSLNIKKAEKACVIGFNTMKISGSLKSKRLN